MKREWEGLEEFLFGAGLFWAFGGLAVFVTIGITTEDKHGLTTPGYVALGAWLGPFAIGGAGAIIHAVVRGVPAAWRARPKRKWVAVTEDAREAHKR